MMNSMTLFLANLSFVNEVCINNLTALIPVVNTFLFIIIFFFISVKYLILCTYSIKILIGFIRKWKGP